MKNILKLFSVLALAFFISSCAKEELTTTNETVSETDDLKIDPSLGLIGEEELYALLSTEEEVSSRFTAQSVVYTMSNEVGGNEVIAFNRNDDGSIDEVGRYSTGGTGSGGGLGNQGALTLSTGGKFLYVVNPGSNDISYFLIKYDGSLVWKGKINSGGELPVSIAVRNTLVYVLNAGGSGNIAGFAFNGQGQIFQISDSAKELSSPMAGAAQISFSANGKVLIVTEKATNTITTYPVLYNAKPGPIQTFPSAGATPFGFMVGNNNNIHVSEAFGGAAGASTVSTYHINNSGKVSLVDGPFATGETAACWVVLDKNRHTLYATNTASNTISSLSVSYFGKLDFANGGNTTSTSPSPIDAAMDSKSNFLYVLTTGNNAIVSYKVGNNGQLTQIDIDDNNLPDRMSGLVVR